MPMAPSPAEALALAVVALRRGDVVAYPTETFYGLGVGALDELALARLKELKGRGVEKAFSVLVVGREMLERVCEPPSPLALTLMERYWPGPLTLALPARPDAPEGIVLDGCVAVRESPNVLARSLVRAYGDPVTTTSANPAGQPPATTPAEVRAAFGQRCTVLSGGATPGGAPSTLARVRGNRIEVLRQGAITIAPELFI
jgi:L-threonylcarbamoyladenylate synthase